MTILSFTVDCVLVVCMSFGYRSIAACRSSKWNCFLNALGTFPLIIVSNAFSMSKTIKSDLKRGQPDLEIFFLDVL